MTDVARVSALWCGVFFFQAGDGIRDVAVTGVQTCALPIWDLGLALTTVHLFLTTVYGQYISLDMASLDLAADVLFLDVPSLNLKECFLTRAVLDDERPVQIEDRSEEHTSELQSRLHLVCRLLLETKKI